MLFWSIYIKKKTEIKVKIPIIHFLESVSQTSR